MRVMAIDYGGAHTGVAISDRTGFIAGFTTTIHTRKEETLLEELDRLIRAYQVDELVLGFPRNMSGTEGPQAKVCRAFADRLAQKTGLVPVLWDERRTTVDAHRILSKSGKKLKEHKEIIDAVAASLILQSFLDSKVYQRA